MDAVFHEEAWKGERKLNEYRALFWFSFGSMMMLIHRFTHQKAPMIVFLAMIWGAAALLFGTGTLRRKYSPWLSAMFTTVDITIIVIAQDDLQRGVFATVQHGAHAAISTLGVLMMITASNLLRFNPVVTIWSVLCAGAGYAFLLQKNGLADTWMWSDLFMLACLGGLVVRASMHQRDVIHRLKVREAYARYLPGPIVARLESNPMMLEFGGDVQESTILFADIRGFTALSERMRPADVVKLLNEYFTEMVDEIFLRGGILDKFIGDGICAVFIGRVEGAAAEEDQAARAIRCGINMLHRLVAINERRAARGEPLLKIGIGIHTGQVVAGNVGSAHRMEYTHIGDAMNTCSRIEGLCKELGEPLLVSDSSYQRAGGAAAFKARAMPPMTVRGKPEPLNVFAVEYGEPRLAPVDQ